MTVRSLKGSIYTTGVCLAAGLGLGITPARGWAQTASSSAAPAATLEAAPIPQTVAVPAAAPAQNLPVINERGYAVTRSTQETVKARYLVQVMEGVLERAVKYAATQMNRRLQAVSPDLLQLSGAARARGFRLDGYGVFFDVEVPAALRQTMGWTFRSTMPNDHELERALTALRTANSGLQGKQRSDADTALKLIELKVRPAGGGALYTPALDRRAHAGGSVAATAAMSGDASSSSTAEAQGSSTSQVSSSVSQPSAATQATQADAALTENPDITYEMEVRDALVGAMLAYGTTLSLQPEEWLTIAARDNQNVIVPGDLTETVTVILRIKGSDLAEYKAGRLDEPTVRRRVEVREF